MSFIASLLGRYKLLTVCSDNFLKRFPTSIISLAICYRCCISMVSYSVCSHIANLKSFLLLSPCLQFPLFQAGLCSWFCFLVKLYLVILFIIIIASLLFVCRFSCYIIFYYSPSYFYAGSGLLPNHLCNHYIDLIFLVKSFL